MIKTLEAALEYLDKGFSVLPVRVDRKPLIKDWKPYRQKHPSKELLRSVWGKYPRANVAIITGDLSGLIVVCADGKEAHDWVKGNLPATGVTVQASPARTHFYYRATGFMRPRAMPTGVKIRGENDYVVAPPSLHAQGYRYEWRLYMDGWKSLPELSDGSHDEGSVKEPGPILVGWKQIAAYLRAHPRTVQRWVKSGEGPPINRTPGGRPMTTRRALLLWAETCEEVAQEVTAG